MYQKNGNTTYNQSYDTSTSEYFNTVMDAADVIKMYYIWIIFLIGFPGNIATICTIRRIKPDTSLTCYIALLAVVDNLTLVVKLIHLILQDYGVTVMNSAECKILSFLGNVFVNYASWILVIISIERFVAVWYPLKVGIQWAKTSRSLLVMMSVLCVLVGVYLHLLWTMTSVSGMCQIAEVYHNYFMINIWYWISVSLYAFIPCSLVFLFNILIIIGIRRSALERRQMTGSPRATTHRDVTIMLIVVSIVFLILSTPICTLLLVGQTWLPRIYSDEFAMKTLIRQVAFVLCDSNHAINFFLYFLSAKRFRRLFYCRESSSSSENVLLKNRSYVYTNKYNSALGSRFYDDSDLVTHSRLNTKTSN